MSRGGRDSTSFYNSKSLEKVCAQYSAHDVHKNVHFIVEILSQHKQQHS